MEAIEAFWQWWTDRGREELGAAIASGEATELPEMINAFITAIHPSLAWQIAPGQAATNAFTVTPDGDPELRGITELWLRSGPPADETWEYHAARQPHTEPVESAGVVATPGELSFTFEYDDLYEQIDLMIDGEAFDDLSRDQGLELAFLAVEAVIGEDNVERWVGLVDISEAPLDKGRALTELPSIVSRFEPVLTGNQWEDIETTDISGWEEHISINRALKSIDHLAHNIHLEVRIELVDFDRLALPTANERESLDALTAGLEETLGNRALAAAVDTVNRHRSLHYFVDDVEQVQELVDAWIEEQAERTIEAMFMVDPAWNNAHRWD